MRWPAAAESVAFYQVDVVGEFERRSERFSQYYDVIAFIAMISLVVWLVRRPASKQESGDRVRAGS